VFGKFDRGKHAAVSESGDDYTSHAVTIAGWRQRSFSP
jgi:hypothetical protein